MTEEQPSLHIDTDWKKQAQEEKRKLAEEEAKRAADREAAQRSTAPMAPMAPDLGAPTSGAPASAGTSPGPGRGRAGSPGAGAGARERAMPEASFATLVNSLVTQILLYLGDLTPRGVEPQVNLDMAKFNIDLLGVIEEKSKGNLSPEEQRLLDNTLYEVRMRYVSVASQYATV
jgi:hypothetical protein